MASALASGAKKNAISYYVFFVINALASFVSSPLLLSYLGQHDFGLWKSCQKVLDFASVADGRTSQALKWIVAKHEGSDDFSFKRRTVGCALWVWVYFLPLLLAITGLLVYFLPSLIKDASSADESMLFLAGVILGINIVIAPLLGVPDAILIGVNRGYKSTLSQAFWLVVANVMMILSAILGYGAPGIAASLTICATLNGVSVYWAMRKSVAWFGLEKPNAGEVRKFFGFSGWVLLWMIVERSFLSIETILLGYVLGADSVTKYTFTSYLVQFGLGISLLTGSAITPGLGKMLGLNQNDKAKSAVLFFRELILLLLVSFGCGLIILNAEFVRAWAGSNVFIGSGPNFIIAILLAQLIFIRSEAQLQDLSLDIKKKVALGGFVSFVSVVGVLIENAMFSSDVSVVLAIIFISRLPLCYALPSMVNKMFLCKLSHWPYVYTVVLILVSWGFELRVPHFNIYVDLLVKLAFLIFIVTLFFYVAITKSTRIRLLSSVGLVKG